MCGLFKSPRQMYIGLYGVKQYAAILDKTDTGKMIFILMFRIYDN